MSASNKRVDQDIDPADEKTGHRGHAIHRLSLGRARFQSGEVGFRDLPVTGQAEEQGDVYVDSFADEFLDGGKPLGRGGNLDEDVGPVQGAPQTAGFLDRTLGILARWGLTSRLT